MIRFSRSYTTVAASICKSYNCIPGPKSYPLLGSVPNYFPLIGKYDPTNVVKSGIIKFHEFGPIIKESFFGQEIVFLYDPADIETLFRQGSNNRRSHITLAHIRKASQDHINGGILVENGPAWAQLRSGSQQALTSEAFEKYLPKFDEFTMRLIGKINSDKNTQKVLEKDFLLALNAHSCDSVCYMLFGSELDSINDVLNAEALTTKVIESAAYFNRMMATMDNGPMLWKKFPSQLYNKLKKCMDDVELIPKREVYSRMTNKSLANGPGILNSWIHEGVKESKTMITLLSDLLLAGIDTTSYTLAFVLYNLSVNKRVQDKLYEELRLIDPELKRRIPLSLETLSRATYLKRVVKESMRLYPVSVGTSRVLEEPCVIAGYRLPENTTVITMNQVTSRLDEYVDKALEFIPERYEANSGFRKIRPFTSLPFGHGPRACIGRRIAESSMYSFLFRLMRNYEIEWVGSKPLGFVTHSLTEPDAPLLFRFTPRDS
ncbi:unnamed protein product [Orchesella dallaii]|uniref:Cytochrome P450 301a1, mitochondrial n=1 Tax=Orchesella dallaii TaxID=48710 RepID=A0ABP1PPL2_9HEXA